jgi:hypothetical protein
MEEFKLINFRRSHPGAEPPRLRRLSDEEILQIRATLAAKLGLPAGSDPLALVRRLLEVESVLPDLDAESEQFDVLRALERAGVRPGPSVLLNWYRFDQIDELALIDLEAYFADLWYPSSDDIDIFDESCDWILSVMHDGKVVFVRFAH